MSWLLEAEANEDLALLGGEHALSWLAPGGAALHEEDDFPGAAASLLVQDAALGLEPDVYRSVDVLSAQAALGLSSLALSDVCQFSGGVPCAAALGASLRASRPERLRQRVGSAPLAAAHCFSDLGGAELVAACSRALRGAGADVVPFDGSRFCCSAAGLRFDVYVSETLAADQAEHGAFVVEVQRVSSGGRVGAWSGLLRGLMGSLEGVCRATGYFAHCRRDREQQQEQQQDQRASSIYGLQALAALDEEDEQGAVPELGPEYARLVALLCAHESAHELRVQLAELLAELAAERKAAETLLRVGALPQVLALLQSQLTVARRGELLCALCALLARLAPGTKDLPAALGAAVATQVLDLASDDTLDRDILRNAAAALAVFVQDPAARALQGRIRGVVLARTANLDDEVLRRHSAAILSAS
jgi:hypothetical protein